MQPAGQIIDANQYYYTTTPAQPMAPQPGVSYQYAGGYYAEPYVVAPTPSQSAQQVVMPVGHPGFIYMQTPSNPVFYSVSAAPPATATTPQYFYTPDVFVQPQMQIPQPMPQPQTILPAEVSMNRAKSAVRPLSTSTPLPTEFTTIPPPMTNQLPYAGNLNVAHLKYHRNMEQDDVLANLSKISVVSEETIGGENEQELERPPRQRRPPPVPFNYKTRMCLTYASGKQCEMGSRCKFAHGLEELRVADAPPRAPNARYKTKLCKNFGPYASNYCPYGLRCEFIHPNDKEYALVCPVPSRPPTRNPNVIENISQNMCNVTPETICEAPPISVTRSAVKPAAEKILLKNRNIAGSMMCLATAGRREHNSDDSAIGSGSSESGGSLAHAKALARARENFQVPTVPMKFIRRRSMSQLTLKRFNSIENLDVAASCSQLANLELNRGSMNILSPLK
ncbi:hypothetical protein V3C99_004005 [Haemonchus contortus]